MTEIQRYNDWSMRLRAERAWLAVEQPMVFYSQLRRYRQSQRIRSGRSFRASRHARQRP